MTNAVVIFLPMLKIYSIAYNRSDLIPIQLASFKRFLRDSFELVVINNGPTPTDLVLNRSTGEKLGLNVFDSLGAHDNAGFSHQRALQKALKLICQDTNPAVLVDNDIFLIDEYSFGSRLEMSYRAEPRFMGLVQGEYPHQYLWPGLLFINRQIIPNLEQLHLKGVLWRRSNLEVIIPDESFNFDLYPDLRKEFIAADSGGGLALFEKDWTRVAGISVDYFREGGELLKLMPEKLRPLYKDQFNFWFLDFHFVHIGRGSNWDYMSDQEVTTKTAIIREWVYGQR